MSSEMPNESPATPPVPNTSPLPQPLTPRQAKKAARKQVLRQEVKELWAQAGWHRPLGGFWFNYILLLVIALPGLLVIGVVLPNYILPFPEALGFSTVTTAYLAPIYLLADFGIKEAMEVYIAKYAETNPRKAMGYVGFYFYFQMFTGIIQVTFISILAITVLPYTNISYATWFFLVYIWIQWPGTPGIFITALNGFQQFDKSNVIIVVQNVAIQTATQVIFILLGRAIGAANPEVGELMGAVAGFIIGSYVDDLVALFIGMYYTSKLLDRFGFKLREILKITFDRQMMKEVLLFGGKVLPSGLSFVIVSALINAMIASWLWNYSTLIGLYYVASGLISALGVSFSNATPITEAYTNGKRDLAMYYIRAQFQWWGLISVGVLITPLLILIPNVIGIVAKEYAEAAPMMYPLFLGAFILFPTNFSGTICQACNYPQYSTYMNFIEQGTRFVTYLVALAPWGVATWFGREAVYFFWLFGESPAYALKGIYGWTIVKRKIFPGMKIGVPWYQTFIAPAIAAIPLIGLNWMMTVSFKPIFLADETLGYATAGLYLIAVLFVFPIFIFMPLYGMLGSWDDRSIDDFRKAARMSGPSRVLVTALYKGAAFGYRHSPWKGKFEIPHAVPDLQALELTAMRKAAEEAIVKQNQK